MRILFLGDVMGRSGRDAIAQHLPVLRAEMAPDVVIVNVENAASGRGVTNKIANDFFAMGVDCLTSGNHIWRQKETISFIDQTPRLLRPLNYPDGTPGRGIYVHTLSDGRKIMIANIMGVLNMFPTLDDPFVAANKLAAAYPLGAAVQASFIDFHAETTSEKVAMGHYLDGRVSAVIGTHTHIPTADDHILAGGTAFQSDAGMCGDYDSVIGTKKEIILRRFMRKISQERFEPAEGPATVCGIFIETNDTTGLATRLQAFQRGGILEKKTRAP